MKGIDKIYTFFLALYAAYAIIPHDSCNELIIFKGKTMYAISDINRDLIEIIDSMAYSSFLSC
jgi:hypothetical protein